jgi:flagellar basal-body rod protein FlgG
MDAQQFKLETIANNLANAGTTAFKRSRTNFEDLYYQQLKLPGLLDYQGRPTATGMAIGLGTRIQSTQVDQRPGSLLDSGGTLDLAIVGDGYFQIQDGNQILYTRAGNFTLNANGEIVLASQDRGRPLEPPINIPQDATDIAISPEGIVSIIQPGSPNLTQVGNIQLARFINPQGLVQKGENLFSSDFQATGQPQISTPGQDGLGVLRQRFLEASNVEPVRELVDLITTQRSFELNSQVIQTADQALQLVANLRRF